MPSWAFPSRKSEFSSGRLILRFIPEDYPKCYLGSNQTKRASPRASGWRADVRLGWPLTLTYQADRAGHPVRAMVAVAAGVLVEVLLVVALGVVEPARFLGGPHLG